MIGLSQSLFRELVMAGVGTDIRNEMLQNMIPAMHIPEHPGNRVRDTKVKAARVSFFVAYYLAY